MYPFPTASVDHNNWLETSRLQLAKAQPSGSLLGACTTLFPGDHPSGGGRGGQRQTGGAPPCWLPAHGEAKVPTEGRGSVEFGMEFVLATAGEEKKNTAEKAERKITERGRIVLIHTFPTNFGRG